MITPNHPVLTFFGEDFGRKTRQCVSCNLCRQFCPVFPQLFALLRQASCSHEVDTAVELSYQRIRQILDECWLELRCPGNLEFSRQVVRARLSNGNGAHPEDRLLSHPQEIGRWGAPIAPQEGHARRNLRRVRGGRRNCRIVHAGCGVSALPAGGR